MFGHDFINDRTYVFNLLEERFVYFISFYLHDETNHNTLYDFIHSAKQIITPIDNYYVNQYIDDNYKSIQKVDKYKSEYGNCYILKVIIDNKTKYLMYVDIEQENKENSAKGILVKVNMEYDYFLDDFTAINSFKKILLEIN